MSKAAQGLFAIVAVLALALSLGAGRSTRDAAAAEPAQKAVRTAGIDVAIGYYTCRGTATGEVTAAVTWQGTTGVFTAPAGLGITVTTAVAPVDAQATCIAITEGTIAVATAETCTVSRTRFVGVTTDFVVVCSGITDDTNAAVGEISRYLAANVRAE
jgi:hypothetical protein